MFATLPGHIERRGPALPAKRQAGTKNMVRLCGEVVGLYVRYLFKMIFACSDSAGGTVFVCAPASRKPYLMVAT